MDFSREAVRYADDPIGIARREVDGDTPIGATAGSPAIKAREGWGADVQ